MTVWSRFSRIAILFAASILLSGPNLTALDPDKTSQFKLVIHGGAGTITRQNMTPEMENQVRAKLTEALQAGHKILKDGGSSLDAVESAILVMEDSPLFNAGKGAVFTNAGTNELDASIMDGASLKAGAVSGLKHIRNPIRLARLVMDKSPHVMLAGAGAEAFARQQGVQMVSQKYFFTEHRWKQLQEEKKKAKPQRTSESRPVSNTAYLGTVGAVALDQIGNLAAGTSTGGMTNKRFGRVGDSPIIGAGTYADNRTCAVSATGQGEYFIRLGVARDISALMEYKGKSVKDATDFVIMEKLARLGGTGGVIAIDREGNHAWPFNTSGMYRGYIGADGKIVVEIYKN
jgi:L-asparaginase / beta-aspartyl-peptidase